MTDRKLQIKLLSRSGELLNVVSCFAGQVSVLRAVSANDLMPYHRALAGIPGPERFSITIGDAPYSPDDHVLIGFGEHFSSVEGARSVRDFLHSWGVPDSALSALLISYGLDGKLDCLCSKVSPHEERVLRILGATYSKGKVLVINDPFEPIMSQWRERVADLLVTFARSKQEIVVVPSLSYRPNCWIDNESVARIQVGENVQKTIGFLSAATDVNAILSKVREEYQSGALTRPAPSIAGAGLLGGVLPQTGSPDEAPRDVLGRSELLTNSSAPASPKGWIIGVVGTGIIAAVVVGVSVGMGLLSESSNLPPDSSIASLPLKMTDHESNGKPRAEPTIAAQTALSQQSQAPTLAIQEIPTTIPEVQAQLPAQQENKSLYVLDLYPAAVRRSVLETFEGTYTSTAQQTSGSLLRAPRVSGEQAGTGRGTSKKDGAKNQTAADLLSMLQKASGSGDGLPDEVRAPTTGSIPQPEMDNLPPEQRREMIRQKFLEAIQRAADQKQ